MTLVQAFAILLRRTRKRRGISQEALALDAGFDRTYVSLLERGQRQPTISTLFALAHVLRVRPSRLIASLERMCRR